MESIFESKFGLKFWRRNPKKQKEIEHKLNQRNLIRNSDCLASRHFNPRFAGNRDFAQHTVVTGRY